MDQQLVSLDELTEEQRQRNRDAARVMVEGQWYRFDPPTQTVPMDRRLRGARKFGQPIPVKRGRYVRFNSTTEEHIFEVWLGRRDGSKGKWFFAPLFLDTGDSGIGCQPCEPPTNVPIEYINMKWLTLQLLPTPREDSRPN